MKYIVYLTTNLESFVNGTPRIYVGVHTVYNDPDIFDGYLGCGVWTNKPNTYMYPKTPFQYAVKKYGINAFVRDTLYIFDTKEEAFNKEAEIVDREFIKLPHVYNASLGGVISGYTYETLYQFDLQGNLKHTWELSIEAEEYYGYPREKFFRAWREHSSFLDSFWAKTPEIDITQYKVVGIERPTYLYDLQGKLVQEFNSQKECNEFLGIESINIAIKRQSIVQKQYYVSDKLVDLFIPKPRLQYKDLTYYIYDSDNNYYGEFKGKEAMKKIGLYSWRRFEDIVNAYKGWCKNFYVSITKIDKVPEKIITHSTQVDVYDKFGNFIETIDSIKETKSKYNLNSGKLRRLDRQDCYVGDYIFKFHKIGSSK